MTQDKATIQTLPAILRLARDHRHPLMPAEARLWAKVRNRGLGFKIRRQHPIWRFIADFYCAEAKLVIEVDGDSHTEADQAEYDAARTEWLETREYKVIRFMNDDIYKHLNDVLREICIVFEERVSPSNMRSDDSTDMYV